MIDNQDSTNANVKAMRRVAIIILNPQIRSRKPNANPTPGGGGGSNWFDVVRLFTGNLLSTVLPVGIEVALRWITRLLSTGTRVGFELECGDIRLIL